MPEYSFQQTKFLIGVKSWNNSSNPVKKLGEISELFSHRFTDRVFGAFTLPAGQEE